MKKMRRGFALALASAMVLLTACGGSQGASGSAAPADTQATQAPEAGKDSAAAADTTAAAASGDVIKIGCPQPLTGTNALVGDTTVKAAQLAVKQGLSVRELEKLAKKANAVLHGGDERAKRVKKRPVFIEEVELSLNEHLGRKVKIQEKGKEKGVLTIEFYSQEDLQNLARLLGGEE